MKKRGARATYFVCCGISEDSKLCSEIIKASEQSEATNVFVEIHGFEAEEVMGPFYKKKTKVLETTRTLKFANETKQAEYEGWNVNAFLLKEPENHAFLIFMNRIDDKKISPPSGTVVVPTSCLRFK